MHYNSHTHQQKIRAPHRSFENITENQHNDNNDNSEKQRQR